MDPTLRFALEAGPMRPPPRRKVTLLDSIASASSPLSDDDVQAGGPDRLLAKFYEEVSSSSPTSPSRARISFAQALHADAAAALDELPLQQRVRARHSLASLRTILLDLPPLPDASNDTLNGIDLGSADGKAWVRKVLKLYDGRVTALERELLDLIEVAGEAAELRRQVAAEKEKAKEMDHAMQSLMPLNFLNQANKTEVGPAMAKITEADLGVMRVELEKTKRELEMTRGRMRGCEAQVGAAAEARAALEVQLAQCRREMEAVEDEKAAVEKEAVEMREQMRLFEFRLKKERDLELARFREIIVDLQRKNRETQDTDRTHSDERQRLLEELAGEHKKVQELESACTTAKHAQAKAERTLAFHNGDMLAALETVWTQLQRARLPDAFAHLFPELAAAAAAVAEPTSPLGSPAGVPKLKKKGSFAALRGRGSFRRAKKPDAVPEGGVNDSHAAPEGTRDEPKAVQAPEQPPLDVNGLSATDRAENDKFAAADKTARAEMIAASVAQLFLQNKQRGDALEAVEKDMLAARADNLRLTAECRTAELRGDALQAQVGTLQAAVKALKRGAARRCVGTQADIETTSPPKASEAPAGPWRAMVSSAMRIEGCGGPGRSASGRDSSPLSPLRGAPRVARDSRDAGSPKGNGCVRMHVNDVSAQLGVHVESSQQAQSPKHAR